MRYVLYACYVNEPMNQHEHCERTVIDVLTLLSDNVCNNDKSIGKKNNNGKKIFG